MNQAPHTCNPVLSHLLEPERNGNSFRLSDENYYFASSLLKLMALWWGPLQKKPLCLSCHPLERHVNSTYRHHSGVTRRRRDNLICDELSPRLEPIRMRRWLKLQPRIANSAALLRAPCSGSLCYGSLFQIRQGIVSFSFFLLENLQLVVNKKGSTVRKSIHFLSTAHHSLCVTESVSWLPWCKDTSRTCKLHTESDLKDLQEGAAVDRNRHASKFHFQWKTPPIFSLANMEKGVMIFAMQGN